MERDTYVFGFYVMLQDEERPLVPRDDTSFLGMTPRSF
jgi:hypothetical protein